MLSFLQRNSTWHIAYQKKPNPILMGKKAFHITEILLALGLLGPSTTREMAHFILSNLKEYQYNKVKNEDARKRELIFLRLIIGRFPKKSGKKKIGMYVSLLENNFVNCTGSKINSKHKQVNLYFLSLKGCFFALGANFNDNELAKFIKNAAKSHLFFAYLNKILDETNLDFIKTIFVKPIKKLIEKDLIRLSDDYFFYFGMISEAIGNEIYEAFSQIATEYGKSQTTHLEDYKPARNFLSLINNTFYDPEMKNYVKWVRSIIVYFYPTNEEQEYYNNYFDESAQIILLQKVMRSVHFAYYGAYEMGIPTRHLQELPLPKELAEHLADKEKNLQSNRKIDKELKRRKITDPKVVDRVRVAKELGI